MQGRETVMDGEKRRRNNVKRVRFDRHKCKGMGESEGVWVGR